MGFCASRNRKRERRLSSMLAEHEVVVVVDGFGDTSGVLSDERGDDASSSCWCSFVMIVIVNGTADDLNEPSQAATRKKAANE